MGSIARRWVWIVVAIIACVVIAAAVSGCSSSTTQGTATPKATPAASGMGSSASSSASASTSGSVSTASDVQTCAECGGKGMAPKVVGRAVEKSGVQVVNVELIDGYYSPNSFTVKADTPVRVVFTGKATGCLAKPMFSSLGKKADLTATGSATIDLGTLKPGVYKFTCAMGMNVGTITAR